MVPRSRMEVLYLHFPMHLHGAMLNYLSTGEIYWGIFSVISWSWSDLRRGKFIQKFGEETLQSGHLEDRD
jgi:hypothetical protein